MILGGVRANLKSCIDKITLDLQRLGADLQTKVDELEELNQSLRQRDKMKDDAIAQLSDQLVVITARLQELEKTITRIYHNLINFSG
jgi:ABC-type transporter Mla subunit MlaD